MLHDPGDTLKSAYFCDSGLISILSVFSDGKSVEVGLVGREGFVGIPLVAGFRTAATRAVAQIEATAFRVNGETLTGILPQCPQLERRLQQFSQMLGTRRSSVTVSAGILQRAGLIAYTRGDVEIIDRRKLEGASCECYGIMQRQAKEWESESEALIFRHPQFSISTASGH